MTASRVLARFYTVSRDADGDASVVFLRAQTVDDAIDEVKRNDRDLPDQTLDVFRWRTGEEVASSVDVEA